LQCPRGAPETTLIHIYLLYQLAAVGQQLLRALHFYCTTSGNKDFLQHSTVRDSGGQQPQVSPKEPLPQCRRCGAAITNSCSTA